MSRIELCHENYENFENWQTHQESVKHVRGAQQELQISRKLWELRKLRKFAKISEWLNKNYEDMKNVLEDVSQEQRELRILLKIKRIKTTAKVRQLTKNWKQPCQRIPTRTTNFTEITRIAIIAKIRKDRHRDPTRTANFKKITRINENWKFTNAPRKPYKSLHDVRVDQWELWKLRMLWLLGKLVNQQKSKEKKTYEK